MTTYQDWQRAPKFIPPKQKKPRTAKPKPVRPAKPKVFDPLAPTSSSALSSQAQSLVQGQMGPLIQAVRDAIEARSRSGQSAIVGATNQLGQLFAGAGPATAQAYGAATQAQGQVNSELANRLGSFGKDLGGEITGKLQAQGAPASVVGDIGGGAATTAQGVANANFAKGSAETGRLIGDSAAAQTYAAKLPAIAGLTGLQHSRDLEAQLNKELTDKIGTLSAQGQDMYVSLYTHFLDNEWQKTLARTSGQFKNSQAEADAKYKAQLVAYKNADLAWKKAKDASGLKEKKREANQRAKISGKNAQTAAERAAESARHNAKTEAQQRANEQGRNKRSKNKKTAGGNAPWSQPSKGK